MSWAFMVPLLFNSFAGVPSFPPFSFSIFSDPKQAERQLQLILGHQLETKQARNQQNEGKNFALMKYNSDPGFMLPGFNSGWDNKTKFQKVYEKAKEPSQDQSPDRFYASKASSKSSVFSEANPGGGIVLSGYRNPYLDKELRKKNYISESLY